MELKWIYDPNTRISKTQITGDLYYTTNDGGQTIEKYVNNQLVDTFHKYGPNIKFNTVNIDGKYSEFINEDFWPDEVIWLSETYPEIVGKLYIDWDKGFLNRYGEIEDIGKLRGMGVLSAEQPISINRICQPASIQELWDYDIIAYSDENIAEDCNGLGIQWIKHKVTGQIYRMGRGQVLYPCCVYPVIHGPWPVEESDIDLHNGIRLI